MLNLCSMSITKLLGTKFLSLFQANESQWVYASRHMNRNELIPPVKVDLIHDDATVMAPILKDENGQAQIVLGLHHRPPLTNKFGKGLHIEASGGLNMDEDSRATSSKNAKAEAVEETGLEPGSKIKGSKLQGVASSAGLTDETQGFFARWFKLPKKGKVNLDKIKEETILKTFTVPLENAINFLHEKTEQGFNVGANTLVAVTNALRALKINSKFDEHNIQAKEIWTLEGKENKTYLQTQGFKNLLHREIYSTAA